MPKLYCLVNHAKHEIPKGPRGKVYLASGDENDQPPRDKPPGFGPGYSWEDVETVIDRNHKGPAVYALLQPNVARVSKIISPKGETN